MFVIIWELKTTPKNTIYATDESVKECLFLAVLTSNLLLIDYLSWLLWRFTWGGLSMHLAVMDAFLLKTCFVYLGWNRRLLVPDWIFIVVKYVCSRLVLSVMEDYLSQLYIGSNGRLLIPNCIFVLMTVTCSKLYLCSNGRLPFPNVSWQ